MLLPLRCLTKCIPSAGQACAHCSGRLWQVLLQLQAEGASEALQGQAQSATQQLAAACSLPGDQALAALHAPDLLGGLASKVRVLVIVWRSSAFKNAFSLSRLHCF